MPNVYLDTGRKTEKIKYDSVKVSSKFSQVYDDLHESLFRVGSTCAILLLFWMSERMGMYNQVSMNKANRKEFIVAVVSNGGKRYSDGTVRNAVRTLVSSNLIASANDRSKREGEYIVSPIHFWKTGSQKDRAESIKAYIYKLKEDEGN